MEIRGSRVMITGGCGAIGIAIATAFARHGKQVWLLDKNIEPGLALAREHPNVRCIKLDFSDTEATAREVGRLCAGEDAPDILVNGVGWSPKYAPDGKRWQTWTMPLEHWRAVMAVNLDAVFHTTHFALPAMIRRGYGRVITIGALAARTGGGGVAPLHYTTAKSALLGFTYVIAGEVGPHGITANVISPGRIDTPMIRDVPDEVNKGYLESTALRRLGTPKDVADTALYLASSLADFVTGTSIEVNGGLTMG